MILQGNGINAWGVESRNNGFLAHITEQRDLRPFAFRQWMLTAAKQDIRLNSKGRQFADAMLCRLGLKLPGGADIRHQGYVDENRIFPAHIIPKLADRLDRKSTHLKSIH